MAFVHKAMRTNLQKLMEERPNAEAYQTNVPISYPNTFLNGKHHVKNWQEVSQKLCYMLEPMQVTRDTAVLSFKTKDTKEIYPSNIDTAEAEKMAVKNVQNIITKLSFVTHNFSAIKTMFEEKET